MVSRHFNVLTAVATMLFCIIAQPARAVDTVPFTQPKGLVQVQGSVDDQPPVPMLVDLGAGVDVLSSDLGRRYVLVNGKYVSLRLSGERVDLPIGKVLTFAIGGVRIDAPHVGIWAGLDPTGVSGLISATAFRNITATFDFPGQRIVIEDAVSLPERTRMAIRVPVILQDDFGIALGVFARFNFGGGKTGLCEIDTGAPGITLDRTFAAAHGLNPGGGAEIRLASVALDGAPQTAVKSQTVKVGNLIYDCDVGNAFWSGRSFTLDLPSRFLYVEQP